MSAASKVLSRVEPRERFERYAAEWREKSRVMSNASQMAMLDSYQHIVGMGEAAIPFILEDLRQRPAHWFWALHAITMENPVPEEDRGRVDKMAAAWVRWGVENGYISE